MKTRFWQHSTKGTETESCMFSCKRAARGVWTQVSSKKTEEQQGHCRDAQLFRKKLVKKKKRTSSAYLNFVQSRSSLSMVKSLLNLHVIGCKRQKELEWATCECEWCTLVWIHGVSLMASLRSGELSFGQSELFNPRVSQTSVVTCRRHPGARQGGN